MKLHHRIKLIPRNNWDYGFHALLTSLAGASRNIEQAPNMEKLFLKAPVWTKSGRSSLYAILKSLDLPAGAKIGVPLFCCSVVFNAITQAGLSPRFIDIDVEDGNISVADLKKKRVDLAAIVPVHMFGNPCDMDAINAVAGDLPVIEDCAQSIFSTYKGKPTGFLSTASFFSFRCGKYVSVGEGSAIFCREPELREKIAGVVSSFEPWSTSQLYIDSLMTFAKATLYNRPWYGLLGYPVGMRLDKKLNLTAKDGFEKGRIAPSHLSLIESRILTFKEKIDTQRAHAVLLKKAIIPKGFHLIQESQGCKSNYYQFALRFENTYQRDSMASHLFEKGIDTAKYLDDIAEEARSSYGYNGDCPNAESLSRTILLVPIHYTLSTSDIEHIARSINEGSEAMKN
jgi:perosamine synthetase